MMSIAQSSERLQIPESLRRQLAEFRRRVWTVKTIEAACAAAFGVVACFLVLFALDRFWDTPSTPRLALFALATLALATVPLALHRWVWRQRRPDQLARLLARKHPRIGDQLLGVIELARDDSEQARSRQLVGAAIEQVAHDSSTRDFLGAVPSPRHRHWLAALAVPSLIAAGLFVTCPAAASNAWARLVAPWKATPRYTFTALEPVPDRLVVAHGEPFPFEVKLAESTESHPARAEARVGDREPVFAPLHNGRYEFELPPRVAKGRMEVRVGDASRSVEVEPMLRPELNAVVASVTLPDYLERPGSQEKDVRGGSLTLVKGTKARISATIGRELASSSVDGVAVAPQGATVVSPLIAIDGPRDVAFRWVDQFRLAGKEPFTLKVVGRDDEAPSMMVEDLPRQKVVLDSELLNFKVRAQDDFGVRRVGIEWQGLDKKNVSAAASGERILSSGGPDKESVEVLGAFSAKSFGIEPQPIALRVFVEDYLPGRPRVVSPPYTLFILTAEQHAIWLTEQLSKWHRQSLEVRDREMQLYETNKQLRALSGDDLDKPENRKKLDAQASAEQANGRRLSGLVNSGEDLVKQAMRNPDFGVGHLERWAEMLQVLKDISGSRMPSVADLLKQAAQAPKGMASATSPSPSEAKPGSPSDAKSGSPSDSKSDSKSKSSDSAPPAPPSSNSAPMAGPMRAGAQGKPTLPPPEGAPKPPTSVPSVNDRESTQYSPAKKDEKPGPGSAPKTPRLLLPNTTLVGGVKSGDPNAPPPPPAPAGEKVDAALDQQRDLLAEFEKVADELNKVLANLEGSTLVKRLKAASRKQTDVAVKIGEQVGDAFGLVAPKTTTPSATVLAALGDDEAKGSHSVSVIMDDMSAYFERRRYVRFKTVLDEMRQKDVIGALRVLGDDLKKEQGLSIAQAEFWSDTLDRWAEDLVDPTTSGACPGSKAKGSLPPSVVLEVLQILEGEINLREETRVAEQARPALAVDDSTKQAKALSKTQDTLKDRVVKVTDRIKGLPDAEAEFAKEIGLLEEVAEVMEESTGILAKPETGVPAIAVETDAIELLLQAKRINPKGGGGGGSTPGGGGKGTTSVSALALMGNGLNSKEVREDRSTSQATGETGPALPEEFRAGLDQYFNKLEKGPAGR